jgi:hypothetical protein
MNISQLNTAMPLHHTQAMEQHEYASVITVTEQGCILKLENGSSVIAQQAFGCPFTPIVDDFVMFVRSANRGIFIVNILQRKHAQCAVIENEHGIALHSNKKIDIAANNINMTSKITQVTNQQYSQTSQTLDIKSDSTQFYSRTVESITERLVQKVKDSFKVIERLEQVTANDIIQNIKNAFIQRSRQVDISAKSDVKINGERIHMG